MATNDEINARVSRTADLVVSRGCAVVACLAGLGALRLLWLERDARPLAHPDTYVVPAAVVFLFIGGLSAVFAYVLRPQQPPADIVTELPDERSS